MKKLLFIFLVFSADGVVGQNKQMIYNVTGLPQSLLLNPGGEARFDMHAGIPILSQISFSAGSSGVSLYDLFGKDQGSINSRISNSLFQMTRRDFFSVREQLELLYLGWRDEHNNYFSAGIFQEMDLLVYFPKDLAVLVWEGNQQQRNFRISDLAFTGEVLNTFHFGVSHYYSKRLNIGIRGKIYAGIMNVRSIDNQGNFFSGGGSGDNMDRPALRRVDVLIRTAGLTPFLGSRVQSNQEILSHFKQQALLGGNFGAGVDLGFTYYLDKKYRITGSILDLGFINHSKDVRNFRYFGSYDTGSTEESELDPDHPDHGEVEEYFFEEQSDEAYFSLRPVKFNAAIDYGFNEELVSCTGRKPIGRRRYLDHVGLQLFSMKRPRGLISAATVYYQKKFSDNFFGKITYTADSFSASNVGLLVSGKISSFNVYLAADNLLDYPNLAKARNASVQIGLQLIIGNG